MPLIRNDWQDSSVGSNTHDSGTNDLGILRDAQVRSSLDKLQK